MVKKTKEFCPADRYVYDWGACSTGNGFAQLDTKQDAAYYGTWANPHKRIIFSYCEGDCITTQCDTDAEFISEIRNLEQWCLECNDILKIDPGIYANRKMKWIKLGLGDLLH